MYQEFAKILLDMLVLTVADGVGLESMAQANVDHREAGGLCGHFSEALAHCGPGPEDVRGNA